MPHTQRKVSPALGIRLDPSSPPLFKPGDTITGHVYRTEHSVLPHATISVELHGRAKSKSVISTGQSTSVFRGRYNLVHSAATQDTVFNGPMHIPVGSEEQSWPFRLAIPTHVNPNTLEPFGVKEKYAYLATRPEDQHEPPNPLPESFPDARRGRESARGFVEYFVRAVMRVPRERRSADETEAFLPIELSNLRPDPPVVDFEPNLFSSAQQIHTYRLDADMKDAQLTMGQKTKAFFGTSSVPKMQFTVEVDLPSVIQLNHPSPLPIPIRVKPTFEGSSKCVEASLPEVKLEQFMLKFLMRLDILAEGLRKPHHAHRQDAQETRFRPGVAGAPVFLPRVGDHCALDIGPLANVRVAYYEGPNPYNSSIRFSPTLTTFNIKTTHRLKWDLRLLVAGESVKASGEQEVRIIPASSDPPPPLPVANHDFVDVTSGPLDELDMDDAAPPSFAEVQAEDAALGKGREVETNEKA